MERILSLVISILILGSVIVGQENTDSASTVVELKNGNWFDGKRFLKKTFFIQDGLFTKNRPANVDKTVDLGGQFVIPPFGDAHTHNLDGGYNLNETTARYLREGVFYVQVLGNWTSGAKSARMGFNKPGKLDVLYANASLTSTYGHPFMVYEPLAMGIYDPSDAYRRLSEVMKSRLGENDAYVFFDSTKDVDEKWPQFIGSNPDVVKIILLNAASYESLRTNGNAGDKGLSAEVAKYVVEKAHAAGRRVFAHVETADDFRLGMRIGVDVFAHAPAYGWDGKANAEVSDLLSEADFKMAAKKKIVVIPTAKRAELSAIQSYVDGKPVFDTVRLGRIIERQRRLFADLRRFGVGIALGTDLYGQTVLPEILYLRDNRILGNLALLKISVEDTPRSIFPARKIGKLEDGYEASFITLKENPLLSFETTAKIGLKFKQGIEIK